MLDCLSTAAVVRGGPVLMGRPCCWDHGAVCLACCLHGDCADCCRLPGGRCSTLIVLLVICGVLCVFPCGRANLLDNDNNNGCGLALLCDGNDDLDDDDDD